MKKLSGLLMVTLFLILTSIATGQEVSAQKNATEELANAYAVLQEICDTDAITFSAPEVRVRYLEALSAIQNVANDNDRERQQKLDVLVEEARALQSIIGSYLGTQEGFSYRLKEGPVSIEITASGVYHKITERLPFLKGAVVEGSVRINPDIELVSQFNALRAEFYGVLVEAAHIDPTDSRLRNLATWGRDTRVIYSEGFGFGVTIIETRQYWNLDLK